MPTLILVGLAAAALLAALSQLFIDTPQQPQIIYIQVASTEPHTHTTGCLPIFILVTVILVALQLG